MLVPMEAAPEQGPDESGNASHEDSAPAKLSGGSVDDGFVDDLWTMTGNEKRKMNYWLGKGNNKEE